MVRACSVKGCTQQWMYDKAISFFSFPSNEELKEKWLKAGRYKTVSKNSCVCSKHFLPEDYTDWTKYGGMRKLKKNAVPSIFNFEPSNDVVEKNLDSDHTYYSEFSPSSEVNMVDESEETMPCPRCSTFSAAESSAKRLAESEDEERAKKKFCEVAVQTCPRLCGPSDREKELMTKIHILQNRLRRRDKKINNVKDLVAHLKKAGECSDNLEETFLKKFNNFDLELFENAKKNRDIAKKTYTEEMKDFAATLYLHSPRAYKFVSSKICLPHVTTLRRWVADELSS